MTKFDRLHLMTIKVLRRIAGVALCLSILIVIGEPTTAKATIIWAYACGITLSSIAVLALMREPVIIINGIKIYRVREEN